MKDETRAVMFSSKTDLCATPAELFNELDQEFHFTVDVCALPENAKCRNYYTPEIDGLTQKWGGTAWCNPPYGRAVAKWVQKAHEEQKNGNTVVMLLPARTDTKWFHEHIYKQDGVEIRFIKGRLKFGGAENPAPFPSMIVIFKERRKRQWQDIL